MDDNNELKDIRIVATWKKKSSYGRPSYKFLKEIKKNETDDFGKVGK